MNSAGLVKCDNVQKYTYQNLVDGVYRDVNRVSKCYIIVIQDKYGLTKLCFNPDHNKVETIYDDSWSGYLFHKVEDKIQVTFS